MEDHNVKLDYYTTSEGDLIVTFEKVDWKKVELIKISIMQNSELFEQKKLRGENRLHFMGIPSGVFEVRGNLLLKDSKEDVELNSVTGLMGGLGELIPASSEEPKSSLKGHLEIDEGDEDKKHELIVKFSDSQGKSKFEAGLENLRVCNVHKDFYFLSPIMEGELEIFPEGIFIYKVAPKDVELSSQSLLKMAKELEKLPYVDYCSLALDPSEMVPDMVLENPGSNEERMVQDSGSTGRKFASSSRTSSPPTGNFLCHQGYLQEGEGMNVIKAWKMGAKGEGATIHLLDFGLYDKHEDLEGADITVVSNYTTDDLDRKHGTASVGVIMSQPNGYGITGIAHKSKLYFYTMSRSQNKWDILKKVKPGDIASFSIQYAKYPWVHIRDIWHLVECLSDKGVIVVLAAGNRGRDIKKSQFYKNWGDSGAIVIGGYDNESEGRYSHSNYNYHYAMMSSWGLKVASLGYAGLQDLEGYNRDYTDSYYGTSAATALVAGALAAIQGYCIKKYKISLTRREMIQLIKDTGYFNASHQIGPRPNVFSAIKKLDEDFGRGKIDYCEEIKNRGVEKLKEIIVKEMVDIDRRMTDVIEAGTMIDINRRMRRVIEIGSVFAGLKIVKFVIKKLNENLKGGGVEKFKEILIREMKDVDQRMTEAIKEEGVAIDQRVAEIIKEETTVINQRMREIIKEEMEFTSRRMVESINKLDFVFL